MSDVGQAKAPVREMLADLLDANPVEQLAERCAVALQLTLQRSNVAAERMGDLADARAADRHQQADRMLDLLRDRTRPGIDDRRHKLPRVARKRCVGARIFLHEV